MLTANFGHFILPKIWDKGCCNFTEKPETVGIWLEEHGEKEFLSRWSLQSRWLQTKPAVGEHDSSTVSSSKTLSHR